MMEEDVEGKMKFEDHAARDERRRKRQELDRMVNSRSTKSREVQPGGTASCTSWAPQASDWSGLSAST